MGTLSGLVLAKESDRDASYPHTSSTSMQRKIMCKAELDEDGLGVQVGRLRLTYLWYADDTTLMAESSEDLKMLITKVKEESANAGL